MYFVAYILAASPDALALSRVVQFSELRSGAGEFCLVTLVLPSLFRITVSVYPLECLFSGRVASAECSPCYFYLQKAASTALVSQRVQYRLAPCHLRSFALFHRRQAQHSPVQDILQLSGWPQHSG